MCVKKNKMLNKLKNKENGKKIIIPRGEKTIIT
jgi:hypothetical protein